MSFSCPQCDVILAQKAAQSDAFDDAVASLHVALDKIEPRINDLADVLSLCKKRLRQIEKARG